MRGHEEASGTEYVPASLVAEWARKDPIARFEGHLLQMQAITRVECDAARRDLEAVTCAVADRALSTPPPVSTPEAEVADVFAPSGLLDAQEPAEETVARAPERRYVDASTTPWRSPSVGTRGWSSWGRTSPSTAVSSR